ncbi:hypothetical protein KQH61_03890 [bacterium]|nr:hypothetical protein [bacterium]MCB2179044.1 hypothetical protein [bacterium]
MSQKRLLSQLQDIDSHLDRARSRLEEIDITLNDNSAVKKATRQAEKAEERFTHARLALKRAEQEVQTQQEKINKNQKALYGGSVRNPKELEDLQMEAEALRRYLSVLEDRQLEEMIQAEDAQSAKERGDAHLSEVKAQIAAQNVDLSGEQEMLTAEVARLETERQGVIAEVEPDLLKNYERIRKNRFGQAVAAVRDGSCAACGAILSAALAQSARLPSKISFCDTCGRILIG